MVQSILTPVLTTSLYFVVFGSAIGSRITEINGVPFAAFIVPGLIMLSVLTESIGNASFGIYFPKWSGTIYELLSAPGCDAGDPPGLRGSRRHQVHDDRPDHPGDFRVLRAAADTASVLDADVPAADGADLQPVRIPAGHLGHELGKIAIRALADGHGPLTFSAAVFYSIDMLPGVWRTISLFNPVVYLISGFRWSFYGKSDVNVLVSLGLVLGIMAACFAVISWMIRSGWRLRH